MRFFYNVRDYNGVNHRIRISGRDVPWRVVREISPFILAIYVVIEIVGIF